jgi:ribosomal protein S18 acetylase RimI-like enzyme
VIEQQELTVRAATLEDAQLIAALINDVDLVELGAADYSAEEVVEDLGCAVDLAADSWLAFDGDRLVSYGVLWNAFANGAIDIDHYVRRDAVPAGASVIDLMVARAAEVAAADGHAEARVHLHLPPSSSLAVAELPARNWHTVRRYHVLRRPVSVTGDPMPAAPTGVALRTVTSEADQRVVYEILEAAFAEHFDHYPQEYAEWRDRVSADQFDWSSMVWIASLDAVDVGALIARNNRETMGWVRSVGVLQAARGRGIASHLLRTAFATFARLGRDTVGLGVDTQNSTGAPRLYEGLGMSLHFEADTWEIVVPATPAPS